MRRLRWVLASVLAGVLATGCAGGGGRDAQLRVFDLGGEATSQSLAPARAGAVRAVSPFDTADMLYRLSFREPGELHAFARHRWAAAPSTLLQRRFGQASGAGPCVAEFEIHEALQRFASAEASEFVLEGRGLLVLPGGARVGERAFRVMEKDAGGNAPAGARAFARAADRLIAEMAAWARQTAACRGG